MNIGIFGASGAVGQRIVAEALSRGHSVTAFARDPSRIGPERAGVAWKVANILNAQSIGRVINDVDVLESGATILDLVPLGNPISRRDSISSACGPRRGTSWP